MAELLQSAEERILSVLQEIGGLAIFLREVSRTLVHTRGNMKPIVGQVASVCFRSLSTVMFSGVFVGAILVLQFNLILARYDAQTFLGGLGTSAIVRQVGPLIISFLLAGKIGAFTAAELGTMRVTEQIDAIECLGVNPIQYLIVPRFAGIVLSSLILLAIGLLVSIGGAMFVASVACGVNFLQYASSIPRFVGFGTVLNGAFQAMLYGSIVAAVSCYKGYTASGGARGVGRAVTLTAVFTNLYIVIANYLSSDLLKMINDLIGFFWKIGPSG